MACGAGLSDSKWRAPNVVCCDPLARLGRLSPWDHASRGHQQPYELDGRDRMRVGIGGLLYLLIGVILAASNEYFENVDALKPLLSALLAIVLWPLLLLGVNLDIE